jgi:uncharacterized membrane protein YkvA (DUF1232 family)
MVWPGVIAVLVGMVMSITGNGRIGPIDVTTVGVAVMGLGAVVLVLGLLRLARARRWPAAGGRTPVASYQDRAYRTGKGKIIAMIAAVVYIVSPIDFIPDFLLPIGIVDDATAFGWLLFAIGQEISRKRRKAL